MSKPTTCDVCGRKFKDLDRLMACELRVTFARRASVATVCHDCAPTNEMRRALVAHLRDCVVGWFQDEAEKDRLDRGEA